MSEAVLGLNGLSVTEKITRIRDICGAVDDNKITYATPIPTTETILAQVLTLEQDEAATRTTKLGAVDIRDRQESVVMDSMNLLKSYVQTTSKGDAVKIRSTMLKVKGGATPPSVQEQVLIKSGKTGIFIGTVILIWRSLKKMGAKFYQVQHSEDGVTGWVNIGVTPTKAKTTITGLVSEKFGFYRVAAGNSLGLGPWSEPIRVMSK